jgi:hypothetical protein
MGSIVDFEYDQTRGRLKVTNCKNEYEFKISDSKIKTFRPCVYLVDIEDSVELISS